ncbi:flagellar basal body P-ring formation chaperone FlgA [Roseateles amylovorans]|uniref:Flagella basal body P-ring formation protein FlgA n=1 Tax=Roseateles amylovorans TaxID=2978473 RepID=A0ABY6AV54_9BURK|nr:flagellar basal body P-ring formation chaperone FlgA [Roseateles amylovorans]UXH76887.1 flagellar basal body P-ring formation chaperone FlgA [Roseateles amylovorans]
MKMIDGRVRRSALLAGLMLATGAAWAAADLDQQVQDVARQALLDQAQQAGLIAPEVQLTQPAPRRRPTCPGDWDITVQDTRSLMRLRLVARCADDAARVPPQDFLLRASLSAEVLVMAQPVASGQPVGEAEVQLQRRDISQTPDAISSLEAGLAARTGLKPGQLLQKRLLAAAIVVRRGDTVRIQARRDGITVEGRGEALEHGARQGVIRVRNAASGRVIQARVLEAGLVEPAELR